jgi:CDGSH-type Zn-finger protein
MPASRCAEGAAAVRIATPAMRNYTQPMRLEWLLFCAGAPMSEPVVYDRNPAELELEPGEYWWCSCGRSMTQPFCDGSHEGTGMEPMSFVIKEKTTVWLCNCKHTKDKPFCDGSHSELPDDIF